MSEQDFRLAFIETLTKSGMWRSKAEKVAQKLMEALPEREIEWGVEYEVSSTQTVFTLAHNKKQAEKWVAESPTDTGLRWRYVAGPWNEES